MEVLESHRRATYAGTPRLPAAAASDWAEEYFFNMLIINAPVTAISRSVRLTAFLTLIL